MGFKFPIKEILQSGKIKIFEEAISRTVESFLNEVWPRVESSFGDTKKGMLERLKKDVFGKQS